jgi:hypothetical protein
VVFLLPAAGRLHRVDCAKGVDRSLSNLNIKKSLRPFEKAGVL